MFQTIKNQDLKIHKCEMKCDTKIGLDIPDPLPDESFCMLICGSPGSGKSSFISSIISSKKKNGVRQSYRQLFEHIIVCSPSIASMSNNIFKDLDDSKKHEKFTIEFMDYIDEHLEKVVNNDPPERTLLILDDIASELKSTMELQRRLAKIIFNRRHKFISTIITSQQLKLVPQKIRTNISHLVMYRPLSIQERESLSELVPIPKNKFFDLLEFVFDRKYNFLFIDLSLRKSSKYRFFKNFDKIVM